jgi:inner membrane transporter RhtA
MILPIGRGSTLDPTGVLLALGAAVCWALYIVFGKRAGHLHAGHSVSLGLVAASLVVVPYGVAHAGMTLLDPAILAAGLGVAIVSSAIPMSLEMMAMKRLPSETFGIMVSLEPAVASLLAMLLLGEHLTSFQWLAIGFIVLASIGSTVTARRARPEAVELAG